MSKISILFALVLAFALIATAQTSSPNDQSSPGSHGSAASQGSTTGQQGSTGAAQQPSAAPAAQGTTMGAETKTKGEAKGEHKVKGCIRSEGGKYSLEDAKGHTYALNTSEDLSAHVGHEVVIHGAVSGGGASEMSKTETSAGAAGGNKEIAVTKVEMVSETCKLGGKKSKSTSDQKKGAPPSQ